MGFPLGAWGKWYEGNVELLSTLGLSKSRQAMVAKTLSTEVLLSSVDIVHMFTSRAGRLNDSG